MTMQTEVRVKKSRPLSNDQKSHSPPQAARMTVVPPKIKGRVCTAIGPRRISMEQKFMKRAPLEPDLLNPTTQIRPPREFRKEPKSAVPRLLRVRKDSPVKKMRILQKAADAAGEMKHSN